MKYLFKKVKTRIELFIADKFVPIWVKLLDLLRKVSMLFTFLCMVAGVVFVAYYLFVCYNSVRVLTGSVFLWVMISVNHALQE